MKQKRKYMLKCAKPDSAVVYYVGRQNDRTWWSRHRSLGTRWLERDAVRVFVRDTLTWYCNVDATDLSVVAITGRLVGKPVSP